MKELKINMQHNPRNGTIEIGNFCSHYRIPVYDNSIDRLKNRVHNTALYPLTVLPIIALHKSVEID